MAKSLKSKVESFVKEVFQEEFGYRPSKVTDFAGNPASEDNNYLLNINFMSYEGKCRGKSSIDYVFFIARNNAGKWQYEFTPFKN